MCAEHTSDVDEAESNSPPEAPDPMDAYRDLPPPGLLARAGIWAVKQYQFWLGPILGGQCRFYPTCSNYSILAIRKYGFFKGCLLTAWRLLRCQPLCRGGNDYP